MTYFEDLSRCSYFANAVGAQLIAIGWLDKGYPHRKGHVKREQFAALFKLAVDPWQPCAFPGVHRCAFCVHTGGPGSIQLDTVTVTVGVANIFVPSADALYVAPSLILHYIDAHGYGPPDAFLRAVESCPPMRSLDYLRALAKHGIRPARPPTE